MKNIFKISILSFVLAALGSCTNDKDPVVSSTEFELTKDASVVSPAVLLEADNANDYAKFNWDRSGFGTGAVPTYSIIVSDHDADPNFLNPIESTDGFNLDPDAREATLTVSQFNVILNKLATFNCGQMNVDVRVKSKLGISTNAVYQYSNPVTLAVTAYAKKPLVMAFVKDTDTPGASQKMVSSGYTSATDYEGFMYLEAGNYKFFQADPCGSFSSPTVFGISGGNSGTLVQDGTTAFTVPATGHYFVKANLTAGTYSISAFNNTTATNVLGIFGDSTKAIGFANTTPMTYDPATKKWSLTISLINGKKFSFKTGNTSPAAVLTGSGTASTSAANTVATSTDAIVNAGTIKAPGDFVDNNTKTKYDIVLDLSTPRHYTYTMTVNPN